MSATYDEAARKAQARYGTDETQWGSADRHQRDMWPAPHRRRKCRCGCGGRATHVGGANAVLLPCVVCGIPSSRATQNPDRTCLGCSPDEVRWGPVHPEADQ